MDKLKELAKKIEKSTLKIIGVIFKPFRWLSQTFGLSFELFVILIIICFFMLLYKKSNTQPTKKYNIEYVAYCSTKYKLGSDDFNSCYDCLDKKIYLPPANQVHRKLATADAFRAGVCITELQMFLYPSLEKLMPVSWFIGTRKYEAFLKGER